MGISLGWRSRRRPARDSASAAAAVQEATGPPRGARPSDVVFDLRTAWWQGAPVSARTAALREELRARQARRDAQRDLQRLRARHWSGERLVEEGRFEMEWWEHSEADPYAVLGLLPGASIDEAAAVRRRVAQECHPDRCGPGVDRGLAERRMIAANAAYDRLRRALHPV